MRHPAAGSVVLSPREISVLRGVCIGESTKEIARGLGITAGTVSSVINRLLRELRKHSRLELVWWAAQECGALHGQEARIAGHDPGCTCACCRALRPAAA